MEKVYQLTKDQWIALSWDEFQHEFTLWNFLTKRKWWISAFIAIAYSLVNPAEGRANGQVSLVMSELMTCCFQIPVLTVLVSLFIKMFVEGPYRLKRKGGAEDPRWQPRLFSISAEWVSKCGEGSVYKLEPTLIDNVFETESSVYLASGKRIKFALPRPVFQLAEVQADLETAQRAFLENGHKPPTMA